MTDSTKCKQIDLNCFLISIKTKKQHEESSIHCERFSQGQHAHPAHSHIAISSSAPNFYGFESRSGLHFLSVVLLPFSFQWFRSVEDAKMQRCGSELLRQERARVRTLIEQANRMSIETIMTIELMLLFLLLLLLTLLSLALSPLSTNLMLNRDKDNEKRKEKI